MTGQKDRYTTTEKLWELSDETLVTPKHDEMIIWLLNTENVVSLFNMEYGVLYKDMNLKIKYDTGSEYGMSTYSAYDYLNTKQKELFLNCLNNKNEENMNILSKLDVPKPIINNWSEIQIEHKRNEEDFNKYITVQSEIPLFGGNKFIIGYVDIIIGFKNKTEVTTNFKVLFEYEAIPKKYIEVKTNIRSFGQTLRQLRTYESFLPKNKYTGSNDNKMYLFTPDKKFKKAFESQGIEVLTYPE